jgi:hypothetical protein
VTDLPFLDRPVSQIAEHSHGCCAAARRWLLAAGVGHGGSVAWVADHIIWAPTEWPIHWCDLLCDPSGDCGVQAAVAEHALRATGATVRRVQMILRYAPQELAQWQGMWNRSGSSTKWIDGTVCYHEAVAVGEQRVRIIDATEPLIWTSAADGLVALRIDGVSGATVEWEDMVLPVGRWHRFTESQVPAT